LRITNSICGVKTSDGSKFCSQRQQQQQQQQQPGDGPMLFGGQLSVDDEAWSTLSTRWLFGLASNAQCLQRKVVSNWRNWRHCMVHSFVSASSGLIDTLVVLSGVRVILKIIVPTSFNVQPGSISISGHHSQLTSTQA
jgi:hypothetical protein